MKSVGETLKSARERKNWTLATASERTNVRVDLLEAIESNAFDRFPARVVASGLIHTYARELGLPTETVLALFRRDHSAEEPTLPGTKRLFLLTDTPGRRRAVISALVIGILLAFFSYGGFVFYSFSLAPSLVVTAPNQDAHVQSPVVLRGKTATDATVSIDGAAVGVNQDGLFTEQIELSPGPHVLTVKAMGRNGKERVVQVGVLVVDE